MYSTGALETGIKRRPKLVKLLWRILTQNVLFVVVFCFVFFCTCMYIKENNLRPKTLMHLSPLVICQTIEFSHLPINKILCGLRQSMKMFSFRRRGTSETNDATTLTGAGECLCASHKGQNKTVREIINLRGALQEALPLV